METFTNAFSDFCNCKYDYCENNFSIFLVYFTKGKTIFMAFNHVFLSVMVSISAGIYLPHLVFHRYRSLISDERLFFLLNAALFSFSHIIFRNWLAIVLTFFGGLMFVYTYRKSNSLIVVFTEHMLYGNFIFTVGIGQYFYLPMTS